MDERFRLDGRVAVVTGASRGLGRAMAIALAAAGADVVLTARSVERLAEAQAAVEHLGRRALSVAVDVTNWESVLNLAHVTTDAFGRIDVLVNNSGVVLGKPLLETDASEWHQMLDTNVNGVFYCCRAFGAILTRQGSGSVINIGSAFGTMGVPNFIGYCTSKAAVAQLTRALAVEWAPYRVRVNAIAPGYFATDMNATMREDQGTYGRVLRLIPLHRMGNPCELEPLVTYLASDASAYMTGEVITLDGGMSVR